MATMERGEGSTISRAEAALEEAQEAQVEQVDTLKDILSTVLTQLNRIQNLDEYMQYLHSEWLATEHDLKVAIQDEATWNGLKIPTRLKLAIKAEILKRENLAAVAKLGSSKSSSSAIPAPFDVKTITQSDAYVDAMSTLEEEAVSPQTTGEEGSLNTPHKESASFHPVTQVQEQQKGQGLAPAADVESKAPAAVSRELSVDVAYDAEESEWEPEEGDKDGKGEGEGEGEGGGLLGAPVLLQDKDNDDDDDECFLRYQVNQKWVKSYSPEQRSVYYFNELTEETVWTLPEGVQASREDEWAAAAPSLSEELAAEAAEAAEAEGNIGETEGCDGGISSFSAATPMLQPTIYAHPVQQQQQQQQQQEELVSPSPSAPAMPADLMVQGIYTEGPVSLEATPISSPDQLFHGANDSNTNNYSQYGHAPVDLGVEAVPAHAVLVDEEELSDSESEEEEDDEEDEDDDDDDKEEEEEGYCSSGGDEGVPVLPENLQMLMDMGFSEHHAARALQKAHNDMQMATIACLRQQEQEEEQGQQYSGFTTAPTDSITGTAAIATDSGSRRITSPGSRGSSRGSSRTSTPDSRGLPTTTEYMRGLAVADTGTASPYPSPREGTRPSSASSSLSGKKQRSIISRLSSSINRTISGAKKVKQAEEDRSQQLEEDH